METFWANVLSGLALLAIGGAAFMAWHDPSIYRRFVQTMLAIILGTVFLYGAVIVGYQAGFYAALQQTRTLNEAIIQTPSFDANTPLIPLGAAFATIVYLVALWALADVRSNSIAASRKPD